MRAKLWPTEPGQTAGGRSRSHSPCMCIFIYLCLSCSRLQMDLVQLFEMIDIDNSGFIESNEFIRPLSRWVRDSKTAPRATAALMRQPNAVGLYR